MRTFYKIIITLALVLSVLVSYHVGKTSAVCPEIITGVSDTVYVYQVTDTVYIDNVIVRQSNRIDTVTVYDTLHYVKYDTLVCYRFSETMPDQAYLEAEVCGRSLPPDLDLSGSFVYLPPPLKQVEVFRVDTVQTMIDNTKRRFLLGLLVGTVTGLTIMGLK